MIMKIAVGFPTPLHIGIQPVIVHSLKSSLTQKGNFYHFTAFLEECDVLISYLKNHLAVHFTIDYVNANIDISNYYPDFIVKKSK